MIFTSKKIFYFSDKNIKTLLSECGFSKIKTLSIGYKWITKMIKYNILFLMPCIGKLRLATGMLVFAMKRGVGDVV